MELQPIENPIIIHPHLLQKFMKHGKDYANLLALYSFYIYHAQLQKTNKPLATDEFAHKGMNWAIDRVKKTKKILKEMKVIEVVQYRKYYYVHLFFIYTKKKIGEILGNSTETEASAPKEPKEEKLQNSSEVTALASQKGGAKAPLPNIAETKKETKKLKALTPSVPPLLKKWFEYCDKSGVAYGKSNIVYWQNQLKNHLTIDQQKAIYTAIDRGWKNFYMVSTKESKYHKFLGKSLMMDRDCDTLLDISYKDKKYIYQFKNIKVTSTGSPQELFNRYGYTKAEVKTAPIISQVKEKIMGVIKRF